jgi:hypothetical protein
MSDDSTRFVGSIPENYDRGLGPILFSDYAEQTARLVAGYAPSRVLECGCAISLPSSVSTMPRSLAASASLRRK